MHMNDVDRLIRDYQFQNLAIEVASCVILGMVIFVLAIGVTRLLSKIWRTCKHFWRVPPAAVLWRQIRPPKKRVRIMTPEQKEALEQLHVAHAIANGLEDAGVRGNLSPESLEKWYQIIGQRCGLADLLPGQSTLEEKEDFEDTKKRWMKELNIQPASQE
jgi:hypothetical protein